MNHTVCRCGYIPLTTAEEEEAAEEMQQKMMRSFFALFISLYCSTCHVHYSQNKIELEKSTDYTANLEVNGAFISLNF